MAIPLLHTKFYVPPPCPRLVARPRLVEQLNEGLVLGHHLSFISAPAGFGKTTLLGAWSAQCQRPVAWLTLDEGDNDPARFLAYVITALQAIDERFGEGLVDALQTPGQQSGETLLTALINQINSIFEDANDDPGDAFTLILDDYHCITAQPIHNALAFLLEHQPGNMHLVIATRTDPPLPLARLRGRGQLTELRQNDLRFTPAESATLLNQVIDIDLTAGDIDILAERTEGWAAGLQMAAVSMQDRSDIGGFIQSFSGSNRYILDYLLEEVLQRQPPPIQHFLLQTAILDRLSAPLCDAVTDSQSSQRILDYLDAANLFVVRLDSERRWYRYHHLFADLLQQRLAQTQPELIPDLHLRASDWYEQQDTSSQGIVPAYIRTLLAAFNGIQPETSIDHSSADHPLLDPLSERELEVLDLIAAGLSNREIANDLFVALSTVKTISITSIASWM